MKTITIEETCPKSTPWGPVQHVKEIAPGIWTVSTAGHGGIYLAGWRCEEAPRYLLAPTPYSECGWFEEDCDWALACAAFPVEFGARRCQIALEWMESRDGYLRDRRALFMASPAADLLRAIAAKYSDK